MFSVFLRAKLDIESKISNLQKTYLQLLKAPICELQFNKQNDKEAANKIYSEKLEKLSEIKKEYKQALDQYQVTVQLIIESKELAKHCEEYLDHCFAALEITIPEEFIKKQEEEASKKEEAAQQSENLSETLDLTSSLISRDLDEDEEEEDTSDKENRESFSQLSDSEYFSPNVIIRKSFKNLESDCYTPAVKSTSKLPLYKQQP